VSWRRVLVCREVYELWRHPSLLDVVRGRVGDEVWAHDVWNGRPREPHADIQKIGWHQDAHYYPEWDAADGPLLTCWIPLVPVDARAGCLRVMPGSHRRGLLPREYDTYGLRNIPDAELDGLHGVDIETEPGDAVFFTDLTVHQALPNRADHVRWTVDIRFAAATPELIRKSPAGYMCASAVPANVEPYETWEQRYDPESGPLAQEFAERQGAERAMGDRARELSSY
jgi:hypothetical protein